MIIGYIGCAACRFIFYALRPKEAAPFTGHFTNELVKVGGWEAKKDGKDHLVCAHCGGTLVRLGADALFEDQPKGEHGHGTADQGTSGEDGGSTEDGSGSTGTEADAVVAA